MIVSTGSIARAVFERGIDTSKWAYRSLTVVAPIGLIRAATVRERCA
jgi:hypothetical protein